MTEALTDGLLFACDEAACAKDARFYEALAMDDRWEIIRAILDAAHRRTPAETVNEWQPIETAPTDGTLVDLWSRVRLTDCRWESEPYAHGIPWGWTNSAFGRIMNATHWRPIPAGPALTEKRPPSNQEGV
jgi:hypothetical protein